MPATGLFTPENSRAYTARRGPRKSPEYYEASRLQRDALRTALLEDTTPSAKAQLMRAWSELAQMKRVILGLGAPKPVPAVNEPVKPASQGHPGWAAQEPPPSAKSAA